MYTHAALEIRGIMIVSQGIMKDTKRNECQRTYGPVEQKSHEYLHTKQSRVEVLETPNQWSEERFRTYAAIIRGNL